MRGVKLSIRTPKHQDIRDVHSKRAQIVVVVRRCRRRDREGLRARFRDRSSTIAVLLAAQAQGLLRAVVVDDVEHVVVEVIGAVAALVHLEPVLFRHLCLHGRAMQVCQQHHYSKR